MRLVAVRGEMIGKDEEMGREKRRERERVSQLVLNR